MKIIEILADASTAETISALAEKHKAHDFRLGFKGEDGRQAMRLLLSDDKVQTALDTLQSLLGAQPYARIVVIPVEAALPLPPENERKKEDSAVAAREALYNEVEKNVRLDLNYVVLVILSTVVAAIGLVENNVAVVIGAMVIAPLLGPNLALGFGAALGDFSLMRKSLQANIAGVGLAMILSFFIGMFWQFGPESRELLTRTDVGMDSVGLALASGAAAALSLTTGLPSVLVGVMVAVALLPPSAALGLTLGRGSLQLAMGAGLLLAINIVCINLAAKVVFLLKGIRPRTWWEKEKAKRASRIYLAVWSVTLLLLLLVIYMRRKMLQ